MKFMKERVGIICGELRKHAIVRQVDISGWKVKEGCFLTPQEAVDSEGDFEHFDNKNEHWYGPDRHYWFSTTVRVPDEFDEKPLWIRVRTELEEWDDARNPQFLLFVNDEIVQGLDINHREVFLREQAVAGEELKLDLQSYTGTLHDEFRLLTEFIEIDPKIQALYYDIQMPLWGMNRMEPEGKLYLDLEMKLNETINLLDLRKPLSESFYRSIDAATEYIRKAIYEEMTGFDDVVATCVGHTHIDVAWLWTVDQTRQKCCRSFATVLKLMDEFPDYRFMSSQPQLYQFVKERYPALYDQIRARIEEGRWEAEGGMWVEADCNLTSGESLVRQFVYGKRFFREEFGVDNKVLWLPDVFGYSAALPQIMKKCGIDYFMTTKLAWNEYNKVPYDTMMWEGIDGSRIFTHLITTLGVGQPVTDYFTTYNGMLHPDAIMGGWERYQNKDINDDILVAYGFGDGGGGPTRTMLETSKRMEKGIKGIPKVRQGNVLDYFNQLWERVKDQKRLPSWVGELYFEYHRGTYTSMARNKRANRKCEFSLMELELYAVLAQALGMEYPEEELKKMWELVLCNQFHDILPGSSIREVYEVTKKEYEEIAAAVSELSRKRLALLGGQDEGVTVWNSLGHERDDIAVLGKVDYDAVWYKGQILPLQKTEQGAIVHLTNVPSKGYVTLRPCRSAVTAEVPFVADKDRVETPFYIMELDVCGNISSLYDKENKREVLQQGKTGNELRIYEDKPLAYSSWNIDVFHTEKSWMVDQVTSIEVTEMGPLRMTLHIERRVDDTIIRQDIRFYARNRRIDFETYVDWKMREHLLKVHFPVDVHTDEASFDIQFGNVKRKLHTNTSWDVARFETCGHKWADLSEGDYGVSLLNDCKYGYSMKDRNMTLTLIKSGTEPNPTADQEEHYFTYSLYPHSGTWEQGGTMTEALNLNVPLTSVQGIGKKERYSFMSVDKEPVILETIKQAEDGDGIIVRLYENQNCRTRVTLKTAEKIINAEETDLLEQPVAGNAEVGEHNISFEILPYEIKTFKVHFEQ